MHKVLFGAVLFVQNCKKSRKQIMAESESNFLGLFRSCNNLIFVTPRYARKDRRPLDPPPVVLLKFFEVRDAVENARGCETELNVE